MSDRVDLAIAIVHKIGGEITISSAELLRLPADFELLRLDHPMSEHVTFRTRPRLLTSNEVPHDQ